MKNQTVRFVVKVKIVQTKNRRKCSSEKNRRRPPFPKKIIENCPSPCTVGSLFEKCKNNIKRVFTVTLVTSTIPYLHLNTKNVEDHIEIFTQVISVQAPF